MKESNIKLRALSKGDAKISWKWRNNEELRYFYSGHPFFVNEEQEEDWINKVSTSNLSICPFGLEEVEGGLLIGMTFLKDINLIHRVAEYAIFIGDAKSKGKGYGEEATFKTLNFAFESLNLNRVFLRVQKDNFKAINLYKKCGFRVEGTLRETVFKKGKFIDEIMMSILISEYKEQNNND